MPPRHRAAAPIRNTTAIRHKFKPLTCNVAAWRMLRIPPEAPRRHSHEGHPMNTPSRTPADLRATLRAGLPDRYLTPDDIAEMFEVPKETVYQWRKKRIGPPGFRIGKHLRYDPADVHAYVTQRKNVGQDAA
jgi:excisionase family DNA binding protein